MLVLRERCYSRGVGTRPFDRYYYQRSLIRGEAFVGTIIFLGFMVAAVLTIGLPLWWARRNR